MVDQTIVGWRAWYVDGRYFDSSYSRWEDLPRDGVIIFVLYNRTRHHRRLMLGVSLYWKDGEIYACDNKADARIRPGLARRFIKRGKWTTDTEYYWALDEATAAKQAPDEALRIESED